MTIIAAQLTDCQDIFDLVNEAYEVEIGDDGLAFKNCARFSALNEVEECLDNTWIIRDENGILVGTVRAVSKEEGVIHVGPLAVRKSHQHQGFGTKLVAFCETLGPIISAWVASCRTDLIPWYSKMGYEEIRRFPQSKTPKITRNDIEIIVMQKKTNFESKS
ncbi:uncharacterized protein LOC131879105 [Tigriopus californicus]|uniref:uncharacterized protein LOC131879105 n=1 Tax=Tigriopus californicus TaxID=6832 RepID=UPI0027DA66A9|nr:uncharacterized protein LOC131879105 [Tigriopus californicus]